MEDGKKQENYNAFLREKKEREGDENITKRRQSRILQKQRKRNTMTVGN